MKMEHAVTAPAAGTVVEVHVAAGDTVAAGAPLVVLDPGEPAGEDPSSSVGAPSAVGGR
jgi:propionyl-CoA carboxylase alpha chain